MKNLIICLATATFVFSISFSFADDATEKTELLAKNNLEQIVPVNYTAQRSRVASEGWRFNLGRASKGNVYFYGAYTPAENSVLTLWYANPRDGGQEAWYLDFDYRGDSVVASLDEIAVHYQRDGQGPVAIEPVNAIVKQVVKTKHGYRGLAQLDFRAVELIREGTSLSININQSDSRSESISFALNDPSVVARSGPALTRLIEHVQKRNNHCCQASAVIPFSEHYLAGAQQ